MFLGLGGAFTVEVLAEHVHHVAADVDLTDVVGYILDFELCQVAAGQGFDLARKPVVQHRHIAERLDEDRFEICRIRIRGEQGQEGREVFFRQQVGDGGDLGIVVHHLVDQCIEQRRDCLRGVLEFPQVDVCGVSGQGRGKPDVRFVEERFDVRTSFVQFTHTYVYRGQRQPVFRVLVADGDIVRVHVRQVVSVVDTGRCECCGEEKR